MKTGIELIIEKRDSHEAHGYTIETDLYLNNHGQLSFAASLLCCPDPNQYGNMSNNFGCPSGWNPKAWLKIIRKPYKERLSIAGSLIAAEIDRLSALETLNK